MDVKCRPPIAGASIIRRSRTDNKKLRDDDTCLWCCRSADGGRLGTTTILLPLREPRSQLSVRRRRWWWPHSSRARKKPWAPFRNNTRRAVH